uniref:Maturin n=1 Tax=Ornithorhynchus anatinus TaxID=9258 RepID=A0A6I8NTU7_ORNAN
VVLTIGVSDSQSFFITLTLETSRKKKGLSPFFLLNRGLKFLKGFLTEVKNGEKDIQTALNNAYGKTLRQHHGWVVRGVFAHVWSESEDCLPFLQLAQDYISSCGKKTLHEVLEKVFKSFRPLLGLPDVDDDAFEEYNADVEEEEPEADHQQMGVSQQ